MPYTCLLVYNTEVSQITLIPTKHSLYKYIMSNEDILIYYYQGMHNIK